MGFIKRFIIVFLALILSGCSYFMVVSYRIYEHELNYSPEILDSACLLVLTKYPEYKIPDTSIIYTLNKYHQDKEFNDQMQNYLKNNLYHPFMPQSNQRFYMYRALDTTLIYVFNVANSDNRTRLSLYWIKKDSIDGRPIYYEELNKLQRDDVKHFFENDIIPKIEIIISEINN